MQDSKCTFQPQLAKSWPVREMYVGILNYPTLHRPAFKVDQDGQLSEEWARRRLRFPTVLLHNVRAQ